MDVVGEDTVEVRLRPKRSVLDRYRIYVRMVEGWGKLRRHWLSRFRPRYVERMRQRRRGECVRCGSCCRFLFKCPYLENGSHCTIYPRRFKQCADFPIDHRDLRYLEESCGFYFVRRKDAGTG